MKNIIRILLIIGILLSSPMHGMKRANDALTPCNQDNQVQKIQQSPWLPSELIDQIAGHCESPEKDLMNKVCQAWHERLHDKESIVRANPAKVTQSHKIKKMFEYTRSGNAIKLAIWLSVLTPEDINNKKDSGQTPLHIACKNRNTDTMQMLMKYGADINRKNYYGYTFLYKASRDGYTKIVQLLLDHGANVNQASNFKNSPLYVASFRGHPDVVKLLLIADDIDIDQANVCGWTPLIAATYNGHIEVVRLLLDHGADVHQKITANFPIDLTAEEGNTALHIAQQKGYTEIVKLIQERLDRDSEDTKK